MGTLSFFCWDFYYAGTSHTFLFPLGRLFLCRARINFDKYSPPYDPFHGVEDMYGTNVLRIF